MREIKFRAWDGKSVRYDVTGFEHGKENEMSGVFLDGDYWPIGDRETVLKAEVMQFTGLGDKNGVEIYEGDIVFVRKAKEQREVVFHEGAFCVVSGGDHYTLNQTRAEGLEVVGNIYEHKHLLEE